MERVVSQGGSGFDVVDVVVVVSATVFYLLYDTLTTTAKFEKVVLFFHIL